MVNSNEQSSSEKLLKSIDNKLTLLNILLVVLIVAIISPSLTVVSGAVIGALVIASLIGIGIAKLIRRMQ